MNTNPPAQIDLSIILCTWNRAESLAVALASIAACVVPPEIEWEVLVVDNNSTDETRAVCESFIQRHPRRFRYLFEGRQGKSFALNSGIQQATGEILAFTDDDLTVDQDWIAELFRIFQTHDCAGVGGRIVPVWTTEKPSWLELDGPYSHAASGGIVRFDHGDSICELRTAPIGANMAYRRIVFTKYGAFRPDLCRIGNLLGGEDSEYGRRLLHGRERLLYVPEAIVYHPVEKKRVERRYFESWAFHYGRWIIRVDGIPDGTVHLFGIPRYLFRSLLKYLLRWISSMEAKPRFHYKLLCCQTFGEMVEARRSPSSMTVQHLYED
ncbi:MAG TPA: glycosyltransferase [Chthoniobacterales bacterium]|nr:glycosyltransferase [Chthoniobacterales bacterium]